MAYKNSEDTKKYYKTLRDMKKKERRIQKYTRKEINGEEKGITIKNKMIQINIKNI